jgi:hypothetical protein
MFNPVTRLSMITRLSREVMRDLRTIAQAAPALSDIAWAPGAAAGRIERLHTVAPTPHKQTTKRAR